LRDRPTKANDIIKFLNSKTREELEEMKIEDRTETILEVKRVLTKRGLMLHLEEKVQVMDQGVQRYRDIGNPMNVGFMHFRIAKSETSTRRKVPLWANCQRIG
jgi:hypothetical protein